MNPDDYKELHTLTGLLELDTINRIFNLHDSNDGNFGYVTNEYFDSYSIEEKDAMNWLKQEHKFKIVDFISPETNSSYVINDIFQTFLDGNSVTKYKPGHLMDFAISRYNPKRKADLIEKNNSEKIFFGKQVITSLENRFAQHGGINQLLNTAKKNVDLFLNNNKCQEITEEVLKAGLEDLDNYITGIITNYNTLKENIENYEN